MRIARSYVTMEKNTIRYMLKFVDEYEQVKAKIHPEYRFVRDYFKAKGICFQNFYKFYSRYLASNRNVEALLPNKRGPTPKYQQMPLSDGSIEQQILKYRELGLNKYEISASLKKEHSSKVACSASTVYRVLCNYGMNRLKPRVVEDKVKIMREYAGSLAHIDCHYLPKGIVTTNPEQRYYVLGVIDDYSRIVWVEVMKSTKSIDATFAMMDAIMLINQRYNIKFEEALTDNGSEFCGSKKIDEHPFERLLEHFNIKHRRTKPYRPQTNGKIERFWRTFHQDVIEGAIFNTLDELKDAVLGYNFYYNEHRPHQGLNGKIPITMLENSQEILAAV